MKSNVRLDQGERDVERAQLPPLVGLGEAHAALGDHVRDDGHVQLQGANLKANSKTSIRISQ